MICSQRLKKLLEILSSSVKGNILNVELLCIQKPSCRKNYRIWVVSPDLNPTTLLWEEALLPTPGAVALSNMQTLLMRFWVSHMVLHIMASYLEFHLELKIERLIF